jgi:Tfp pilus assembly protein PilF
MNNPYISVESILMLAHEAIDHGNHAMAMVLLDLVLQHFPEQADSLHAKGVIYLQLADKDNAKLYLQKALKFLVRQRYPKKGRSVQILGLDCGR